MPVSRPQMLTCSTPAAEGDGTCAGRLILDQGPEVADVRDLARTVGWKVDEAGRWSALVEAGARRPGAADICPSCVAGNPPILHSGSCLNCGGPVNGGWCGRCSSEQPI